ncbi:MAG: ATP-binding protein [Paludibacteraceae bacterium]|nr:ATP-binding protein [Paludibacteraceae bacterium]
MIIQEFSFGNFRSFKDIQTLNLTAAKLKSKDERIDISNVIRDEDRYKDLGFLKTKAIYGANASGKSNMIKALGVFINIINRSVKDEEALFAVDSFELSTETENEPSFFQLIFWIEGVRYRYGFEASVDNVSSEWLFAKSGEREISYFIREDQKIEKIDKTNFAEGDKLIRFFDESSDGTQIFRYNSLFLSTISALGAGKLSKEIIDNISSIIFINGLGENGLYELANDYIEDPVKKEFILKLLNSGDIGDIGDIDSVDVSSIISNEKRDVDLKPNKKKRYIFSKRKVYDANLKPVSFTYFNFKILESEGTLKLFELSPLIYDALKGNRPLFIDEFDARFHPLLTKKIVELFNSEENKGAQLVFVTHDTNLLSTDLLRRDQIEFVEKDKYGASHLYSLAQFKGIRNDASFEKDYIQGKYGAIPFLGDFKKLLDTDDDA